MVIGITGGAGSGKSYVCKLVGEHFHIPVIDSDSTTKEMYVPGSEVLQKISDTLGKHLILPDGSLDRKGTANLVFHNPEALQKLNAITHPATIAHIKEKLHKYTAEGNRLILVESAIAGRSGYVDFCDELWLVYTSLQERIRRLSVTRGYDSDRIQQLLSSQDSSEEYLRACKRIIVNEAGTTEQELLKQAQFFISICS